MAIKMVILVVILIVSRLYIMDAKIIGPCQDLQDTSKCTGKAPWQTDGVCHFNRDRGINNCLSPDSGTFIFVIEAIIQKVNGTTSNKQMFMRGSGPGLSWERSKEMVKSTTKANTWSITIEYQMDSLGLQCTERHHCTLNQKAVEFRLYTDQAAKEDMKGRNFYIELPVSKSLAGSSSFKPPVISVYPWFSSHIRGFLQRRTIKFASELDIFDLKSIELVDVVVPPSYNENVFKRYPLVIILDSGRSHYPVFEYLYSYAKLIEEVFVMIVDIGKLPITKQARRNTYSYQPFERSNYINCKKRNNCGRKCNNCWRPDRVEKCNKEEFIREYKKCYGFSKNTQGLGESLVTAIVDTVLPEIREAYNDRIEFDPPIDRLTLIGYGDLAVIAFAMGLSRPDIIGNVAALSPAFFAPVHRRTFEPTKEVLKQMNYFVTRARMSVSIRSLYSTQKYYFSHGENERVFFPIADPLNLIETIIKRMETDLGFKEGDNLMYQIVPGALMTYPFEYIYPLMSLLQSPMLFFYGSLAGVSAARPRSVHLTEDFFATRRNVEINANIRNNNTDSTFNSSRHFVPVNQNKDNRNCESYMSFSIITYMGSISEYIL